MRKLIVVALFVLSASSAFAQNNNNQNCGNGLPCGSLPWPLPTFPAMPSPTPIDLSGLVANPALQTPTPVPTSQAVAISTIVDLSPIEDAIGTMEAGLNATPLYLDINGTATAPEDVITSYVSQSGGLFSYMKGLNEGSLGVIAPLVNFSLLAMLLVLLTQISAFLLPIAMALFGFIRKIITLLLDFWPF